MTAAIGSSLPSGRRSGRLGSRKLKLFLVLAALGAGIGYLAVIAAKSGTAYYVTPSELTREAREGVNYRLGGRVVPGSIAWDTDRKNVSFRVADGSESVAWEIEDRAQELPVTYSGVVPNLFEERAFVVVGGTYSPGGVFEADSLIIKHESEFITERRESLEE